MGTKKISKIVPYFVNFAVEKTLKHKKVLPKYPKSFKFYCDGERRIEHYTKSKGEKIENLTTG